MRRIISTILALSLCICLLPSSFASNTDQFSFRDGITWGMTIQEVKQRENSLNYEYLSRDDFPYSVLAYMNIPVSMYPNATLIYLFREDILYGAIYETSNADNFTLQYLYKALRAKYGDSKPWSANEVVEFFTYLYGLMYLSGEDEAIKSMYSDLGTDNYDDFISALFTTMINMSPEQFDQFSTLGEVWTLPDDTVLLFTDTKEFNGSIILYFAPTMFLFNTDGL